MRAMNVFRICFAALLLVGCEAPPPLEHAGHGEEDAGVEPVVDAGVVDAGSVDAGVVDAGVPQPGVPVLLSVVSAGHAMDISWQLPSSGCSTVALRLKPPAGAYATARTFPGTSTSTQYSPGHSSGTYCFQVSCMLGAAESAPSNELCAAK